MGIFSKLSTVIKSNINDLISRAENPEKMLNQIILDMRDQLAKAKREVAAAIADERKLKSQVEAEVKQPFPWFKGDRFTWTMFPTSKFDANISNSAIQDAKGNLLMWGAEAGTDKVKVTGKGDYWAGWKALGSCFARKPSWRRSRLKS